MSMGLKVAIVQVCFLLTFSPSNADVDVVFVFKKDGLDHHVKFDKTLFMRFQDCLCEETSRSCLVVTDFLTKDATTVTSNISRDSIRDPYLCNFIVSQFHIFPFQGKHYSIQCSRSVQKSLQCQLKNSSCGTSLRVACGSDCVNILWEKSQQVQITIHVPGTSIIPGQCSHVTTNPTTIIPAAKVKNTTSESEQHMSKTLVTTDTSSSMTSKLTSLLSSTPSLSIENQTAPTTAARIYDTEADSIGSSRPLGSTLKPYITETNSRDLTSMATPFIVNSTIIVSLEPRHSTSQTKHSSMSPQTTAHTTLESSRKQETQHNCTESYIESLTKNESTINVSIGTVVVTEGQHHHLIPLVIGVIIGIIILICLIVAMHIFFNKKRYTLKHPRIFYFDRILSQDRGSLCRENSDNEGEQNWDTEVTITNPAYVSYNILGSRHRGECFTNPDNVTAVERNSLFTNQGNTSTNLDCAIENPLYMSGIGNASQSSNTGRNSDVNLNVTVETPIYTYVQNENDIHVSNTERNIKMNLDKPETPCLVGGERESESQQAEEIIVNNEDIYHRSSQHVVA